MGNESVGEGIDIGSFSPAAAEVLASLIKPFKDLLAMPIATAVAATKPTVLPSSAPTTTIEQLQAQLQILLEQLKTLQGDTSLDEQAVAEETSSLTATFEKNLYFGMKNDPDIKNLQEFLTEQGHYKGPITGNFFLLTLEAVKKFQTASGVNSTGYFGVKSREAVNKKINSFVGN